MDHTPYRSSNNFVSSPKRHRETTSPVKSIDVWHPWKPPVHPQLGAHPPVASSRDLLIPNRWRSRWKNPWVQVTFFTIPKKGHPASELPSLIHPLKFHMEPEVRSFWKRRFLLETIIFRVSSRFNLRGSKKIPIGSFLAGRPCKGKRSPTADWLHSRHPSALRFGGIWRTWGFFCQWFTSTYHPWDWYI